MEELKRTWKLFITFYKINIKSIAVYDKDFYFGILSMMMEYAAGIVVLLFVFNLAEDINGWSLDEVLFLYGFNLIGFSLWSCFFINTISLPYYIRDGSFDRFLLRPVSPIFQIMMDGFDEDSWGELITGLLVFLYAWFNLGIEWYLLIFTPIFFISACLIYAGISIMLSTLSFFTIGKSDFANLTVEFKEFAKYPLSIYNKALQVIFTTIIPIGFAAFYPSLIFIKDSNLSYLIVLVPFVSYAYFKFSKFVWYRGMKRYGSTGS